MPVDLNWEEAISYTVAELGHAQEDAEDAAKLMLDAGMGAGQLIDLARAATIVGSSLVAYASGLLTLMAGTV